jgi:uroporphyrinogen-III synthase
MGGPYSRPLFEQGDASFDDLEPLVRLFGCLDRNLHGACQHDELLGQITKRGFNDFGARQTLFAELTLLFTKLALLVAKATNLFANVPENADGHVGRFHRGEHTSDEGGPSTLGTPHPNPLPAVGAGRGIFVQIDARVSRGHLRSMGAAPLAGLTVLAFESRRAGEMAELIRRQGGQPVTAPSMREVPLEESPEAVELLARLEAGSVDVVILLTGVGTRTLVKALAPRCPPERFAELLARTTIVARGPKPVAALRELGLAPQIIVPEPNTWREILTTLDERSPVRGRRVAVQEYGRPNPELLAGLRERGAEVLAVPIYRWAMPEDRGPLEEAVRRFAAGEVDLALFTSARQVDHVMHVADTLGLEEAFRRACERTVIASIGPVCSEALTANDLPVDLEPEHPKMGQLVRAVAESGPALLRSKRLG